MKIYKKIMGLMIVVFLLLANPSNAESTWWEKGINIFKTPDESNQSKEPGLSEIGEAFKEALRIGSENVVRKLGNVDGFNAVSMRMPLFTYHCQRN